MTTDPRRWIAELLRSHDELTTLVSGLSQDDLTHQSACSEWDVSQALSHLGSGAELGFRMFNAVTAGKEPPGREANQPVWDRWNAMSPVARAASFLEWDERHVGAFEALDGAALGRCKFASRFFPTHWTRWH